MKHQALFSSKDKLKTMKMSSAAVLLGSLRVKGFPSPPKLVHPYNRVSSEEDGGFLFQNHLRYVPYLFGYKKEDLSFQNNPKYLDPSYKMDVDL